MRLKGLYPIYFLGGAAILFILVFNVYFFNVWINGEVDDGKFSLEARVSSFEAEVSQKQFELLSDLALLPKIIGIDSIFSRNEVTPADRNLIGHVLRSNLELLDSVSISFNRSQLTASRDHNNYYHFNFEQKLNRSTKLIESPFHSIVELSRNYENHNIELVGFIEVSAYFREMADLYLDQKGSFPLLYREGYGLVPLLKGGTNEHVIGNYVHFKQKDSLAISEALTANLGGSLTAEVMQSTGSKEAIIAYTPINLFDANYGIVLIQDTAPILNRAVSNGVMIFLFTAISVAILTVLFAYSFRRTNRSERALSKSKMELAELVRQQQLLLENSDDFTYRHGVDFTYDYISENVSRVLGYAPDELLGGRLKVLTENPLNDLAREATKKILQGTSKTETFYTEVIRRNGEAIILE